MVTATFSPTPQATRFECVVNMRSFQKKFVGPDGKIFTVNEVVQGPAGLTVYYTRENDGNQFSCLIDAFSERFKEIQDDNV